MYCACSAPVRNIVPGGTSRQARCNVDATAAQLLEIAAQRPNLGPSVYAMAVTYLDTKKLDPRVLAPFANALVAAYDTHRVRLAPNRNGATSHKSLSGRLFRSGTTAASRGAPADRVRVRPVLASAFTERDPALRAGQQPADVRMVPRDD